MATRGADQEPGADRLHSGRRTLAVLEALAARPHGATPKELGHALDLHLSTCYRLLNTLVAAGYVVRCSSGLFRLGRRLAYLNDRYLATLRPPPEILAFLQALQVATGETAILSQLKGDDVVGTAIVLGSRPGSHPAGYVGIAAPAHAVGSGRALLAWLPPAQLDAYVKRLPATPVAPWFVQVTPESLRADLAQIRQQGYAFDRGEGNPDVCCVAAPIHDASGLTASISVAAPCLRLRQEKAATVAVVREIARAVGALQTTLPPRHARGGPSAVEPEGIAQEAIRKALTTVTEAMSRVS